MFYQDLTCFPQLRINVSDYHQLQNYLKHFTLFGLKWPVHDLVLETRLQSWTNVFGTVMQYS